MSERALRREIVKLLRPVGAMPVENPACPGTPDVAYVGGWIELKKARRWPQREGPLKLDHFTQQQFLWLERHILCGGRAHVLLQVGREHLLFWGTDIGTHKQGLGSTWTQQDCLEHCTALWPKRPSARALRLALEGYE